MKLQVWHVVLIVALFALALSNGVYGLYRAHQPFTIPSENRKTFVHAIVASDSTRSMRNESVTAGKEIIETRVIPSIGPSDRLICLAIGPRYGLSNTVFGGAFEDQPPQLPEGRRAQSLGVLARARERQDDTMAADELHDLARDLRPLWPTVDKVRQSWSKRLSSLQRPKADGTAIRALLEGVQAEFETPARPKEERWLIIVSDLIEEPPASAAHRRIQPVDHGVFGQMHVVLVYPHDSERDWSSVKSYWRDQYFEDADVTVMPFSAALDNPYLIPPNPFSGLQSVDLRSTWDFIRPLVLPELTLLLGLATAGWLWRLFGVGCAEVSVMTGSGSQREP